jgi:hypothetical protein
MPRGVIWTQVRVTKRMRVTYGSGAVDAYRHCKGFMLVLFRPLPAKHAEYKRVGVWLLCDGLILIGRKGFYGWNKPKPPRTWAALRISMYRRGIKPT